MAAPDLTQRECCFVQKQGTDDLSANAVGAPFSRLTIAAALLDLATNYPVASATNPHIVAIGPGTFDTPAFQIPPWTYLNGECDGEGNPTTILRMSGDITLSSGWSANTAQTGGIYNMTIRALEGTPAIDFTMPVPVAGNPVRRVELVNVTHNLRHEIFEATSTGDVYKNINVIQDGSVATDTLVITSGTSAISGRMSAAAITIKDKTSFAAAGTWHGVSTGLGSSITVSSVAAAGCSLRLLESSARALVINQTAPGAVLVTADSCSLPVRSAVTFTGTATLAANLVYFNDAAGLGYNPTTPADWPVPVPINVQQALDALRSSTPGEGVNITYTGTPLYPIQLSGVAASQGFILTGAVSGATTYTPFSGMSVSNMNYGENTNGAPFSGLTSISFNNLVQVGALGFTMDGLALLTSFSCPELLYAWGSFSITVHPVLTTFSLPKLIFVSGNFSPATMASLTTLSTPALTAVKQAYGPNTMALLTTLSANNLAVCTSFAPATMASLTTLSFPALASVLGPFQPSTMAALTTWNFPALVNIGSGFAPTTMATLTSLTMPALVTVGTGTGSGNFAPAAMALLTTLTAAVLTTITGTFAPTTMAALTTLSFPSLATITGAVSAVSMASLTTISFAGMVTYGSTITFTTGLGALTSVTLGTAGTLKTISGATINISGQALTSASVNAILALLVTLDGTGGTTLWGAGKTLNTSGGTSGAPTGQGIVDKATLQARGATITTN